MEGYGVGVGVRPVLGAGVGVEPDAGIGAGERETARGWSCGWNWDCGKKFRGCSLGRTTLAGVSVGGVDTGGICDGEGPEEAEALEEA
jgi:hypothetical protein